MALFVKICGLASPGAVSAAIGFEADMLGFTFDPAGPNPLTASQAGSLLALVPSGSDRVGVFADAEDTLIGAVLKQGGLDLIQCNGDEEPGRVRALRTTFKLPVIKSLAARSAADLEAANAYKDADWLRVSADSDVALLTAWRARRPWLIDCRPEAAEIRRLAAAGVPAVNVIPAPSLDLAGTVAQIRAVLEAARAA